MSSALLSYEDAAAIVSRLATDLVTTRPAVERVTLAGTAGRVLAETLRADSDQPPFARSTRDGFACRAAEASTHALLAVAGTTRAGEAPAGALPALSVWEVMTGAPIPDGADAVAMVEHVEKEDGGVRLHPSRLLASGENIVAQGAQARAGDELLPIGTSITFAQIALAASCGYSALDVFIRPRVAILTTGDELVPVESTPAAGQIRNSNAPMLASMVETAGGEPLVLPVAADTVQALDFALEKALQADLLLISGGVSAGKFDLVEPALARRSAQFHFTGVRMQPGKPLVFGELLLARSFDSPRSLPFFGLPGNPVSSAVTFLLFGVPILAALAGRRVTGPRIALAQLAANIDERANPSLTRFLPARWTFNPPHSQLPLVQVVPWQGSGDLAALARSNCFLVLPEGADSPAVGEIVRILLS